VPVVPSGGSFDLPTHQTATVTAAGAEGLENTVFSVEPEGVVRIDPSGADTVSLAPLAVGEAAVSLTTDGDTSGGVLRLVWSASVSVIETKVEHITVQLRQNDEPADVWHTLPLLGSETDIALNRPGRMRLKGYGLSGAELELTGVAWESGNPARFTLVADGSDAQLAILTPVSEADFQAWTVSCDDGIGGTRDAGGSFNIKGDASTAVTVDVDLA
jgi:hypothetical protein